MRPAALGASSEITFVHDLQSFVDSTKGQKIIGDKSLYLLRNADSKIEAWALLLRVIFIRISYCG